MTSNSNKVFDINGVKQAHGELIVVGHNDINELLLMSKSNKFRSRICFHQDNASLCHEMLICLDSKTQINPHSHQNKHETFLCIAGRIELTYRKDKFSDEKKIMIGSYSDFINNEVDTFLYRMNAPYIHSHKIITDHAVVMEITDGPF
tara:strand:- start:226 stop:669 length:444 start_codon:yes stop_codon:yes gene_type:complete